MVTNPKIRKETATPPTRASEQIDAWINSPSLTLLSETEDFSAILFPLIQQPRIRGPIVHDARIAALCLAHGVDELLTKDRDFQLFAQLKTRDPFTQ
jgi:predicted nucleic acid-binding protein